MDSRRWGRWMEEGSNRRIAWDEYGDVQVSTVFLGIDTSLGRGVPRLFETMIFGLPNGDEYQARCATREEALLQHREAVGYVRGVLSAVSSMSVEEPPPQPPPMLPPGFRKLNMGTSEE